MVEVEEGNVIQRVTRAGVRAGGCCAMPNPLPRNELRRGRTELYGHKHQLSPMRNDVTPCPVWGYVRSHYAHLGVRAISACVMRAVPYFPRGCGDPQNFC